jgi:hypothetical protein
MIEAFLDGKTDPEAFCLEFTALWTQDVDEQYALAASWPEPYDKQLLAAREQGEISQEEFSRRWSELWGYAEDVPYVELLDKIHSACAVFDPQPRFEWEIDEAQLRADVARDVALYKATLSARGN